MFKRKQSKKSKLFREYLTSYLIIMILCLVIVLIAYNMSVKIIEVEITNAHYKSLIQVKNISESILKELEMLYIQIGFDEKIQMLMRLPTKMTPEQLIEMTKLAREIKTYNLSYPVIKDVYLYFERSDTVLSNAGRHRLDIFKEAVFSYDTFVFNEWISGEDVGIDVFSVTDDSGEEKNMIAYIRTLPIGRKGNSLGKLIIVVDDATINEEMNKFEWIEQGTRFTINKDNEIFLANKPDETDVGVTYESLDIDNAIDSNGDMVLSYVKSDSFDWKYVYIIPKNIFFEKAKKVKRAIEISFLIVLCLGFFLSYFFAKRYYEPIDKLIVFIQNNLKKLKKKDEDEYNFIKTIISNTVDEREEYQEKANKLSERLKNDFLLRMLRGQLKNTAFEDMRGIHNIQMDDNSLYSVMIVYLDDISLLHYEESAESETNENLDFARLIVINAMDELFFGKYGSIYAKYGDSIIFIIDLGEKEPIAAKNDLNEMANKFTDIIKNRFKLSIFSSLSSCNKGLEGIKESYQEANKNIEYYLLIGREQDGNFYSDKSASTNILNYDFIKVIEKFKQNILAKEVDRAKVLMKDMFEKLFSDEESSSANVVKYRMSEIRNTLINAIENLMIYFDNGFLDFMEITDRLYGCKNVDMLQASAEKILDSLNEYLIEKERLEPDLAQKTLRYINENFHNCDMNISSIANHLEVNAPQLSRQFKKNMGIGPLEYLQLKRVEEAKNLLINSDKSIKEITRKVGFVYEVSFFRVFKKFEGVTPGIFRGGS